MKKTWVVVADEAIARIMEWRGNEEGLHNVEEVTDPMAHAKGVDIRTDAEGRRGAGAPAAVSRTTGNATASAGESDQHLEAAKFAETVCGKLAEALRQKRFEQLTVVAAPRFLGLLRKGFSKELASAVNNEIDKDFVHFQNDDIARRLFSTPAQA